ncbi:MAG TPA: acetyl-CoA carboxylase, carboxyltransferase subunit beta [Candidatus Limnocylindrales bacterium]|nr:acetyl-CoA carboxylase, carboxyltransferase subunit beta [Candidatus Limnocylindrales bacterium]
MSRPAVGEMTQPADWLHCPGCHELIYGRRWHRNAGVCPDCGAHGRLTARTRIEQLTDPGSFREFHFDLPATDPLGFVDSRPYPRRLAAARTATGEQEAVTCGEATVDGYPLALAVMDFRFLGGSLGTGVGERLVLTAEYALRHRLQLLVVTASGGARMQEGALSLLQMAKVSQVIAQIHEAGLLFVTLITDPTYGGVAASYATQADVIIAEPGARLGFAGPRVIRNTLRVDLPAGFQTAEFLLRHGAIDLIAERTQLRDVLSRLLRAAAGGGTAVTDEPHMLITDPDRLAGREPWGIVALARNAKRPTGREYINLLANSFLELHGDRQLADSPSMIGGIAEFGGVPVMVVATQKGHSTAELLATNFGMAGPEGYRKSLRLFRLAEKLGLPVVTLVDTPGAYPGVDAEEQGKQFESRGKPVPVRYLDETRFRPARRAVTDHDRVPGAGRALSWHRTPFVNRGQNVAIGLTGLPDVPAKRTGATARWKSHWPSSAAVVAHTSRSQLSSSHRPIATRLTA